jgi:hypothetical protein
MYRLSFWSRVAFICNICLILAWLTKYFSFIPKGDLESTVMIAGLAMSFIINALVNLSYLILLLRKKSIRDSVPVWLAGINFLFLILQFYLIVAK